MKSSTICGRKMITEPTPGISPSARKSANSPAGSWACTVWTSLATPASMKFIAGCAQAKMSWKKATITAAKSSGPIAGCRTIRSTASLMRLFPGRRVITWSRIDSTQPARAWISSGGIRCGRLQSSGLASSRRSLAIPMPRWPTTPRTGTPSARSSRGMSSLPLRAWSSSVIVSTRQVGISRRRTCASISSERSSVQASAITASASGASLSSPSSTRITTSSSGLPGVRL